MKKSVNHLVLGFIVSCFTIFVSVAQPTLDFARAIGGANNDYGTSIAVLDSSVGSNVNLIYTTGVLKGSLINFNPAGTAKNLSSQLSPNGDLYIAKYGATGFLTASGNNAAFRVGSNADNDVSTKVYVDASKNVYVVGTCTANSRFAKDNLSGLLTGSQGLAFIIKYDKDYTIQWGISFGATLITDGAQVRGISVDNSGNVYVTGVFQGTSVNFNPGSTIGSSSDPGPFAAISLTSNGGYDAFVAKYNNGGKCLWAVNAGGTSSDEGYGVGHDLSGNVYATGIFRGQNIDFDPSAGTTNLSETGGGTSSGDIFVAKYSSSGSLVSAFSMGNVLFEGSTAIAVDASGDFAISGFFAKDALAIDFDPGIGTANATAVGSSGTDLFIVKYSSALAYQWHKTVGSTGNERANHLKLSGSNLYVTGSYEGTATDFGNSNPLTTVGGIDAFMAGYSFATGNCLFASSLGGTADEEGLGIDFLNNKLYVTGYQKGSGDYDPGAGTTTLTNNGGQDIFFAQYNYVACTLPSITTQPASLSRCVGASASFTVAATNAVSYQWKKGASNASGTSTNATYNIASVLTGDAASYTVEVTNACGTVTSTPAAVLTVNDVPSITTQPASLSRCVGASASFTVAATNAVSYQWKKGASNASGTSTNATYNIASVLTGDAASYTVEVTNACGTVTSIPAAVLTVNDIPSITTAPTSLSRCVGASASFTVAATNAVSYQWKKGASNASGTSTNATYNIASVVTGDAANYTVEVTNACGTVTSTPAAVLTVSSPVTANAGTTQNICNSTVASLSANDPSPGVGAWTVSAGSGTVTTPTSATSGITGLTVGSSTTLTWTITNGPCVTSANVILNVSSPATANAGVDQALCNVTSTTLSATGTGSWSVVAGTAIPTAPSSATTSLNGLTIGGSTTMRWTVTNGACSASSDVIITVSSPGSANAGADQVLCNVSTTTLGAAGSGTWTKISGTGVLTTPTSTLSGVTGLTVGAVSVFEWTVTAGACSGTDQVSIEVSAPATGSAGANQNSCGITTASLSATGSGGTWSTLSGTGVVTSPSSPTSSVTALTVGSSSVFQWTVTNGACTSSSNVTIASNAPVTITTQPVSSTTLCTGNTFNLNVVATGSGALTYQWKKGTSNASGVSTASSYSKASVVFGDQDNYAVDVSNVCGTVTSSLAQLTVQNLAISTQPFSQTVCPGVNVTFSVVASGPSIAYQWKKNNADLFSQNASSLMLSSVSATDAASYTVLVSGCSNSILSDAATLALSVCTGTVEESTTNRFRIYPNPTASIVHITGFGQDPIRSILIMDVNGEVVYDEKELNASSHEVSVAAFAQGLYHVILFTGSGNKWIEKIEVAK
jgi:Secretion system C-terminal sorting domain